MAVRGKRDRTRRLSKPQEVNLERPPCVSSDTLILYRGISVLRQQVAFVILILHTRKPRHRGVKKHAREESRHLNPAPSPHS